MLCTRKWLQVNGVYALALQAHSQQNTAKQEAERGGFTGEGHRTPYRAAPRPPSIVLVLTQRAQGVGGCCSILAAPYTFQELFLMPAQAADP